MFFLLSGMAILLDIAFGMVFSYIFSGLMVGKHVDASGFSLSQYVLMLAHFLLALVAAWFLGRRFRLTGADLRHTSNPTVFKLSVALVLAHRFILPLWLAHAEVGRGTTWLIAAVFIYLAVSALKLVILHSVFKTLAAVRKQGRKPEPVRYYDDEPAVPKCPSCGAALGDGSHVCEPASGLGQDSPESAEVQSQSDEGSEVLTIGNLAGLLSLLYSGVVLSAACMFFLLGMGGTVLADAPMIGVVLLGAPVAIVIGLTGIIICRGLLFKIFSALGLLFGMGVVWAFIFVISGLGGH